MTRFGKLTIEIYAVLCLTSILAIAQQAKDVPPIIDVHLLALHANSFGSPTPAVCAGDKDDLAFVPIDPKNGYSLLSTETCSTPMHAPQSDEQVQRDTFALLEKYKIAAVTSGSQPAPCGGRRAATSYRGHDGIRRVDPIAMGGGA